jgi:hypothetical protein
MKRSNSQTERITVTKLEDVLNCNNFISSDIKKNDKTVSWDGTIFVYTNVEQKKKIFMDLFPCK